MARFRKVASVNDVPEGRGIAVEIEGKRLALFNVEGEFFAIEATCAQHRAPLEKGVIHGESLHCPWHGVAFDVKKGICSAFPAESSAATYEVKVENADILLAI
jgi:nitrite reductase/ring-hydroxylating ferredoxin subunit